MSNPDANTLDPRIESHIEAFEDSLASNNATNRADFLPDRSDPKFLRIVIELIRVDLELSWEAGRQKSLDDYIPLLPELASDDDLRTEIAFEEFRQRTHHGQRISVEQFSTKYNVNPDGWTTVVGSGDQTTSSEDFDDLAQRVPTAGQRWRDFEVIREIGRGAMSRVLLAKQTSLSGRQVVLKFSPKNFLEADKLARLQHPNIVPVFSVYEDRDFHVFCMPYMGDVTLSQCQLPLSEREAVGVAAKLASAIHHAHDRGILHNDIKPANVLWHDDEPMLLDFNLAAESADPTETQVGGTIPYMAPESLVGLQKRKQVGSEQADVYSLGVLLLEMVTNEQAFGEHAAIDAAVVARRELYAEGSLKTKLANCSASFYSIIDRCLRFEPAQRYRTAGELLTDLERHQNDQPLEHCENALTERLRKWCLRHPRVTSATSIAAIAVGIFAVAAMAWIARERHFNQLEAESTFIEFQNNVDRLLPELSSVGLDAVDAEDALTNAENALAAYVSHGSDWKQDSNYLRLTAAQQSIVDAKIEQLALMTSTVHTELSRGNDATHQLAALRWLEVVEQENAESQSLLLLKSYVAEDQQLRAKAVAMSAIDTADQQMVGWLYRRNGQTADAIDQLRRACESDPKDFSKWFNLHRAYVDANEWETAEQCLTICLVLQPDSAIALYSRGICRRELRQYEDAIDDYTRFLELANDQAYGLLNRAICYKQIGELGAALKDLNQTVSQGFNSTRPLLIRSRVRGELGDKRGAAADLKKAMAAIPRDELGWVARGTEKMARSPKLALDDFKQALKLNPRSHSARRNMAFVLSEKLSRPAEAIECLNELIEQYPLDAAAIGGRGVLLARNRNFDKAIDDAKRIVAMNGGPRALLQAACIYSMASSKRPELQNVAVSLLGSSFKVTPKLAKLAAGDGDLQEIHDFDAFKELCAAANKFAAVPDARSAIENAPN